MCSLNSLESCDDTAGVGEELSVIRAFSEMPALFEYVIPAEGGEETYLAAILCALLCRPCLPVALACRS